MSSDLLSKTCIDCHVSALCLSVSWPLTNATFSSPQTSPAPIGASNTSFYVRTSQFPSVHISRARPVKTQSWSQVYFLLWDWLLNKFMAPRQISKCSIKSLQQTLVSFKDWLLAGNVNEFSCKDTISFRGAPRLKTQQCGHPRHPMCKFEVRAFHRPQSRQYFRTIPILECEPNSSVQ